MAETFSPVDITVTFEMEFSGAGGGWTDVTSDVRLNPTPRWGWGITGSGPTSLVARPGSLTFGLNNSDTNSGSLEGYYSPDHTNARSGFELEAGVRVKLVYSGTTKYKKYYVSSITPMAGPARERVTVVEALDWMAKASRLKVVDLAVQTDALGDALFQAVTDDVTQAPANTTKDTGVNRYAFAFDDIDAEKETARRVYQKIAQSDLDRIYLTMDATDGETLVYQNHLARMDAPATTHDFDGDSIEISANRRRDRIINTFDVSGPIRTVDDDATTVLATNDGNDIDLPASTTITVVFEYRDPDNQAERVSGVEMVTPVSGTDWVAWDYGKSNDRTSDVTVTATFGVTQVSFAVENTSSDNLVVSLLQARGKGLYSFGVQHARAEDSTSQSSYGEKVAQVKMPYQQDLNVLQAVGDFLLDQRKDPVTDVDSFSYWATRADALATAALATDVGGRIGIDESVTGLTDSGGNKWWVNSVDMEWRQGSALLVTYGCEFAEPDPAYWRLGATAADQLGTDTKLGYF